MEKTAYNFTSNHLGQAFVKELKEMGYKINIPSTDNLKGLTVGNGMVVGFTHKVVLKKECPKFQLESQWNEALEHARGQLKPEFKEGDWVTWGEQSCVRIEEFFELDANKGFIASGIDGKGVWRDSFEFGSFDLRKATDKEVEQALIKEAERRGYKHGNFRCLIAHSPTKNGNGYVYQSSSDILYLHGNALYKKGEWAEIVENKFFDWNAEKCTKNFNHYRIGCESIPNDHISILKKWLKYVDDKTVKEVLNELEKI